MNNCTMIEQIIPGELDFKTFGAGGDLLIAEEVETCDCTLKLLH